MYLSELELKKILSAYDCDKLINDAHYQVEPDAWVYLFHGPNDKKYVLISADYLDFDFDHFPQLLRFDNGEFRRAEFLLQKEVPPLDPKKAGGSVLFEYAK